MKIGSRIKQLRMLRNLTQEELANRCELTKGYISQLENDLTEPAISTLEDILLALGSSFKEFFSEDANEKIVFKKEDYFSEDEEKYKITWLVLNSQKNAMEPILVDLKKGAVLNQDMPHEGEEFGYVLKGKIELYLGTAKFVLESGDTFYFTADKTHYIKNINSGVSEIIWVSSPPNF